MCTPDDIGVFCSLDLYSVLPSACEISCSVFNAFFSLTKKSFLACSIFTDIEIRLVIDMHCGIYRVEWLSKKDVVVQKKTCEYVPR